MPTVLRWRGHRFYFYSHEPNEPPHIHVDRAGETVKFWLQPLGLARNSGFSPKELGDLTTVIRERQHDFLEAWNGYFGAKR